MAERSNAAVLKTEAAPAPSGAHLHFLRKIALHTIASGNEMHGSDSAWLSRWLSGVGPDDDLYLRGRNAK